MRWRYKLTRDYSLDGSLLAITLVQQRPGITPKSQKNECVCMQERKETSGLF